MLRWPRITLRRYPTPYEMAVIVALLPHDDIRVPDDLSTLTREERP